MWKPIKNVQAKYNMTCADLVLPPPESVWTNWCPTVLFILCYEVQWN